jgi:hypothetical protein
MRLTNAMRSDIVERAVKKAYDTLDSLARKQVLRSTQETK